MFLHAFAINRRKPVVIYFSPLILLTYPISSEESCQLGLTGINSIFPGFVISVCNSFLVEVLYASVLANLDFPVPDIPAKRIRGLVLIAVNMFISSLLDGDCFVCDFDGLTFFVEPPNKEIASLRRSIISLFDSNKIFKSSILGIFFSGSLKLGS